MKRNIILLGVLATLLFVLPTKVSAAAFVDPDSDGVYENDEAISVGQFGTIAAGDASWTYSDEEAGEKTWTFNITVNNSDSYVYFTLVPSFVSIESVSSSGDYLLAARNQDGENLDVLFEPAGTGNHLRVTVITTDTGDEGCLLDISPLSLNCSVDIPGYYFDDNGNAISEEEYNQVCGNATTPEDPNDVPSPETGSVVPYIAIGGSLLAIVAVYFFSKRSNKVYKI